MATDMNYINIPDIYMQMQPDEFKKIQTGDATVFASAVATTVDEVRNYLVPRYDLSTEFADLLPYNNTKQYGGGDRVYLDAPAYSNTATYATGALALQDGKVYRCKTAINTGETFTPSKWDLIDVQYTKYFGTLPKPRFDMYAYYNVGDEVFYNGRTYRCKIGTTVVGQQGALNYTNTAAIPKGNVPPDDTTYGAKYWEDLGAYTIAAGTLPTDATKWTQGDSRNVRLVSHFVAMVIYHMLSRVSPQNIPNHRVERYMGKDEDRTPIQGRLYYPEYSALGYLQAASASRITANLPEIQPKKGNRVLWNSKPKTQNGY